MLHVTTEIGKVGRKGMNVSCHPVFPLLSNQTLEHEFNFYLNIYLATVYEVNNGLCVPLYIHCIKS